MEVRERKDGRKEIRKEKAKEEKENWRAHLYTSSV